MPWLAYAEILLELGKRKEAEEAWKKVAPVVRHADPGLPPLRRLEELAASVKVELPEEAPKIERLEELGPLTWRPPTAPVWSLDDADGKAFCLRAGTDAPMLVLFYLGSKCTHCVQQLGKFSALAEEFRKQNISIVAVSSETAQELSQQRAKAQIPYPFPLLSDAALTIFKEYRCYDDFEKIPLHGTFLIDSDKESRHRIRWQDISFDPFMDAPFLLAECKRLLALP